MIRYARCSSCRDFYLISHLVKVKCSSCDYRAWRCHGGDCGGRAGAMRSILAHFHWWRTRGEGVGGHDRKSLLDALKGIRFPKLKEAA